MKSNEIAIIDEQSIKDMVHEIRGQRVMLDYDLARLYGYETKDFNRQVKNNIGRFPPEFRFRLSKEGAAFSRCKNFTLDESSGRGSNIKYLPYAFTEQGVYMQKGIE